MGDSGPASSVGFWGIACLWKIVYQAGIAAVIDSGANPSKSAAVIRQAVERDRFLCPLAARLDWPDRDDAAIPNADQLVGEIDRGAGVVGNEPQCVPNLR